MRRDSVSAAAAAVDIISCTLDDHLRPHSRHIPARQCYSYKESTAEQREISLSAVRELRIAIITDCSTDSTNTTSTSTPDSHLGLYLTSYTHSFTLLCVCQKITYTFYNSISNTFLTDIMKRLYHTWKYLKLSTTAIYF